jgi:hypothetical protein
MAEGGKVMIKLLSFHISSTNNGNVLTNVQVSQPLRLKSYEASYHKKIPYDERYTTHIKDVIGCSRTRFSYQAGQKTAD